MAGGSAPSSTNSTTTQKAPKYLEPYLAKAALAADKEFSNGPNEMYSGSGIVGLNDLQEQALQGSLNTVNSDAYMSLGQNAIDSNNYAMSLPQNIQNDPTLKAMADANAYDVQNNLVKNTMAQLRGDAVGAGTYDSTRTDIAEGNAIEGAAQQLSNANARMYGDAYNNALKMSQVATQAAPGLQDNMMKGNAITAQVGDAYGAMDQARLDEQISKFYGAQNKEADNIAQYVQLLQGTNTGGTTTTTGSGASGPNGANRLLGAGMTGLGAYGMASAGPAAMAGMATPIGWGAAALALMAS